MPEWLKELAQIIGPAATVAVIALFMYSRLFNRVLDRLERREEANLAMICKMGEGNTANTEVCRHLADQMKELTEDVRELQVILRTKIKD